MKCSPGREAGLIPPFLGGLEEPIRLRGANSGTQSVDEKRDPSVFPGTQRPAAGSGHG